MFEAPLSQTWIVNDSFISFNENCPYLYVFGIIMSGGNAIWYMLCDFYLAKHSSCYTVRGYGWG